MAEPEHFAPIARRLIAALNPKENPVTIDHTAQGVRLSRPYEPVTAPPTEPATPLPPSAEPGAYAQGYAEAVARLRDDDRYRDWWTSSAVKPDSPIRQHLADYLETVGPDGVAGGAP